jgi:hypothetical protein
MKVILSSKGGFFNAENSLAKTKITAPLCKSLQASAIDF